MTNESKIEKAAENMDWQQVVLNGGPPCFDICDDGNFCGRAERWVGHEDFHKFKSLADLLRESQKPLAELLGPTLKTLEDYASRCQNCSGSGFYMTGVHYGADAQPEQCEWCDSALQELTRLRNLTLGTKAAAIGDKEILDWLEKEHLRLHGNSLRQSVKEAIEKEKT